MKRHIDKIIVHCAATLPRLDIGVDEIRKWHTEERGWSDIGYHVVIRRDGTVEEGRPLARPGAHAKGENHSSIGVCYVGGVSETGAPEDNRTADQSVALFKVIQEFQEQFPGAAVLGHRDLKGVTKACPCFDVRTWYTEACSNTSTKRKELREERKAPEKTDHQSMTSKSSLSIIWKLWSLLRSFLRPSGV